MSLAVCLYLYVLVRISLSVCLSDCLFAPKRTNQIVCLFDCIYISLSIARVSLHFILFLSFSRIPISPSIPKNNVAIAGTCSQLPKNITRDFEGNFSLRTTLKTEYQYLPTFFSFLLFYCYSSISFPVISLYHNYSLI